MDTRGMLILARASTGGASRLMLGFMWVSGLQARNGAGTRSELLECACGGV